MVVAACAVLASPVAQTEEPAPLADTPVDVGRLEWLCSWSQELAYGLRDYSLAPVSVIRRDGRLYWWIAAGGNGQPATYRFSGPTLTTMIPDPDDAGRARAVSWLIAQEPTERQPDSIAAVYWDIGARQLYAWSAAERGMSAAVSEDGGEHFRPLGIGLAGQALIGAAAVVKTAEGVAMYLRRRLNDGREEIAMATLRSDQLARAPQPWSLASSPTVTLDAGGPDEALHNATDVSVSLTNTTDRYLMVSVLKEPPQLLLRRSADGRHWSAPLALVTDEPPASIRWPKLVDDGDDPSVIDEECWLFYSYSPDPSSEPYRLVRRRLRLAPSP